jgi:hypothetical protein
MSFVFDLRRKLKTPEFIANNGGWVLFTILILLPAIITILGVGVTDTIFNAFLSLFSIDAATGKIGTQWTIKYALLFLFCVFIPGSIYLLCMRLKPERLKRKAEEAYELITKEVSRIYTQMSGASTPSRHNLEKLNLVFRVDHKYGLRCDSKISLIAKQDTYFWKYFVGAEPEGDGQDFISDINFSADVDSGRSSAFLPLKNETHAKEVMIAFLPYIKQGEKCEVSVSWTWPNCMGQLHVKSQEQYEWVCDSVDNDCVGELRMEYVFDKKLGDIHCRNIGINPTGTQLNKTDKPNETIWTLANQHAPLGQGKTYRLVFERR